MFCVFDNFCLILTMQWPEVMTVGKRIKMNTTQAHMKPEEPQQPNSRRDFIKKAAVGVAAFTIVPRYVLGGQGFIAPSDKLTKAVIGVGGMGRNHFPYDGTQVVAICDVDKRHIAKSLPMLDKGLKPLVTIGN